MASINPKKTNQIPSRNPHPQVLNPNFIIEIENTHTHTTCINTWWSRALRKNPVALIWPFMGSLHKSRIHYINRKNSQKFLYWVQTQSDTHKMVAYQDKKARVCESRRHGNQEKPEFTRPFSNSQTLSLSLSLLSPLRVCSTRVVSSRAEDRILGKNWKWGLNLRMLWLGVYIALV